MEPEKDSPTKNIAHLPSSQEKKKDQHLGGLEDLMVKTLEKEGFKQTKIKNLTYFRPTKNWDIVAQKDDHYVVIEFKTQSGKDPKKNLNNRIEEAIGSAFDNKTYSEKTDANIVRGYFLLLEDSEAFTKNSTQQQEGWPGNVLQIYQQFCKGAQEEDLYRVAMAVLAKDVDEKLVSEFIKRLLE